MFATVTNWWSRARGYTRELVNSLQSSEPDESEDVEKLNELIEKQSIGNIVDQHIMAITDPQEAANMDLGCFKMMHSLCDDPALLVQEQQRRRQSYDFVRTICHNVSFADDFELDLFAEHVAKEFDARKKFLTNHVLHHLHEQGMEDTNAAATFPEEEEEHETRQLHLQEGIRHRMNMMPGAGFGNIINMARGQNWREIANAVRNQNWEEIANNARNQNWGEIADTVRNQNWGEIADTVRNQNWREMADTVRNQNWREAADTVRNQNWGEIADTVRNQNWREMAQQATTAAADVMNGDRKFDLSNLGQLALAAPAMPRRLTEGFNNMVAAFPSTLFESTMRGYTALSGAMAIITLIVIWGLQAYAARWIYIFLRTVLWEQIMIREAFFSLLLVMEFLANVAITLANAAIELWNMLVPAVSFIIFFLFQIILDVITQLFTSEKGSANGLSGLSRFDISGDTLGKPVLDPYGYSSSLGPSWMTAEDRYHMLGISDPTPWEITQSRLDPFKRLTGQFNQSIYHTSSSSTMSSQYLEHLMEQIDMHGENLLFSWEQSQKETPGVSWDGKKDNLFVRSQTHFQSKIHELEMIQKMKRQWSADRAWKTGGKGFDDSVWLSTSVAASNVPAHENPDYWWKETYPVMRPKLFSGYSSQNDTTASHDPDGWVLTDMIRSQRVASASSGLGGVVEQLICILEGLLEVVSDLFSYLVKQLGKLMKAVFSIFSKTMGGSFSIRLLRSNLCKRESADSDDMACKSFTEVLMTLSGIIKMILDIVVVFLMIWLNIFGTIWGVIIGFIIDMLPALMQIIEMIAGLFGFIGPMIQGVMGIIMSIMSSAIVRFLMCLFTTAIRIVFCVMALITDFLVLGLNVIISFVRTMCSWIPFIGSKCRRAVQPIGRLNTKMCDVDLSCSKGDGTSSGGKEDSLQTPLTYFAMGHNRSPWDKDMIPHLGISKSNTMYHHLRRLTLEGTKLTNNYWHQQLQSTGVSSDVQQYADTMHKHMSTVLDRMLEWDSTADTPHPVIGARWNFRGGSKAPPSYYVCATPQSCARFVREVILDSSADWNTNSMTPEQWHKNCMNAHEPARNAPSLIGNDLCRIAREEVFRSHSGDIDATVQRICHRIRNDEIHCHSDHAVCTDLPYCHRAVALAYDILGKTRGRSCHILMHTIKGGAKITFARAMQQVLGLPSRSKLSLIQLGGALEASVTHACRVADSDEFSLSMEDPEIRQQHQRRGMLLPPRDRIAPHPLAIASTVCQRLSQLRACDGGHPLVGYHMDFPVHTTSEIIEKRKQEGIQVYSPFNRIAFHYSDGNQDAVPQNPVAHRAQQRAHRQALRVISHKQRMRDKYHTLDRNPFHVSGSRWKKQQTHLTSGYSQNRGSMPMSSMRGSHQARQHRLMSVSTDEEDRTVEDQLVNTFREISWGVQAAQGHLSTFWDLWNQGKEATSEISTLISEQWNELPSSMSSSEYTDHFFRTQAKRKLEIAHKLAQELPQHERNHYGLRTALQSYVEQHITTHVEAGLLSSSATEVNDLRRMLDLNPTHVILDKAAQRHVEEENSRMHHTSHQLWQSDIVLDKSLFQIYDSSGREIPLPYRRKTSAFAVRVPHDVGTMRYHPFNENGTTLVSIEKSSTPDMAYLWSFYMETIADTIETIVYMPDETLVDLGTPMETIHLKLPETLQVHDHSLQRELGSFVVGGSMSVERPFYTDTSLTGDHVSGGVHILQRITPHNPYRILSRHRAMLTRAAQTDDDPSYMPALLGANRYGDAHDSPTRGIRRVLGHSGFLGNSLDEDRVNDKANNAREPSEGDLDDSNKQQDEAQDGNVEVDERTNERINSIEFPRKPMECSLPDGALQGTCPTGDQANDKWPARGPNGEEYCARFGQGGCSNPYPICSLYENGNTKYMGCGRIQEGGTEATGESPGRRKQNGGKAAEYDEGEGPRASDGGRASMEDVSQNSDAGKNQGKARSNMSPSTYNSDQGPVEEDLCDSSEDVTDGTFTDAPPGTVDVATGQCPESRTSAKASDVKDDVSQSKVFNQGLRCTNFRASKREGSCRLRDSYDTIHTIYGCCTAKYNWECYSDPTIIERYKTIDDQLLNVESFSNDLLVPRGTVIEPDTGMRCHCTCELDMEYWDELQKNAFDQFVTPEWLAASCPLTEDAPFQTLFRNRNQYRALLSSPKRSKKMAEEMINSWTSTPQTEMAQQTAHQAQPMMLVRDLPRYIRDWTDKKMSSWNSATSHDNSDLQDRRNKHHLRTALYNLFTGNVDASSKMMQDLFDTHHERIRMERLQSKRQQQRSTTAQMLSSSFSSLSEDKEESSQFTSSPSPRKWLARAFAKERQDQIEDITSNAMEGGKFLWQAAALAMTNTRTIWNGLTSSFPTGYTTDQNNPVVNETMQETRARMTRLLPEKARNARFLSQSQEQMVASELDPGPFCVADPMRPYECCTDTATARECCYGLIGCLPPVPPIEVFCPENLERIFTIECKNGAIGLVSKYMGVAVYLFKPLINLFVQIMPNPFKRPVAYLMRGVVGFTQEPDVVDLMVCSIMDFWQLCAVLLGLIIVSVVFNIILPIWKAWLRAIESAKLSINTDRLRISVSQKLRQLQETLARQRRQ